MCECERVVRLKWWSCHLQMKKSWWVWGIGDAEDVEEVKVKSENPFRLRCWIIIYMFELMGEWLLLSLLRLCLLLSIYIANVPPPSLLKLISRKQGNLQIKALPFNVLRYGLSPLIKSPQHKHAARPPEEQGRSRRRAEWRQGGGWWVRGEERRGEISPFQRI